MGPESPLQTEQKLSAEQVVQLVRVVRSQVTQRLELVLGVRVPLQVWQTLTSEQVRHPLIAHEKQSEEVLLRVKFVLHSPQVALSISQKAQLARLQVNPHCLLDRRVKEVLQASQVWLSKQAMQLAVVQF